MSHALSFTHPTLVRRGRSGVIALWVVQVALAGVLPGFSSSNQVSNPARLPHAAKYQVLPGSAVASVLWPPWPRSKYIARSTTMG